MFNRKTLITGLLIVALIAIVYFSTTNRSQHGDGAKWIVEHGAVANRHPDLDKFCLGCHKEKLGQNKNNFCNKCHQESNIKLVK